MSFPVAVNTADGACWTLRTVTAGGIGLYAPEAVTTCPEFVMATLEDLAAHGVQGSADALPMPVGPAPQETGSRSFDLVGEVTADDYADAVYAAEQAYSGMRGQGYKGSISVDTGAGVSEAELDSAMQELSAFLRVRLALASAQRGRRELRARVAELEAAQQPAEGSSYPSALPWARLMDAEDLAEFLAEVEHAIATPGATPAEALAAVEKRCGTWRVIAEAQHAHNTAPGPDAETKTTAGPQTLRAEDTADLVTLAPAQHAEADYNAAFRTISLELTATREQWSAWQKALAVDLARTTNRGSCTTSHATWRGIHVVIRCYVVQGGGE
ncbi:hypothetical protein ACWDVX_22120 [Streptomyces tendae]